MTYLEQVRRELYALRALPAAKRALAKVDGRDGITLGTIKECSESATSVRECADLLTELN